MTERNGPEPLVPTGRRVIHLRHSSIYILDKVDSHVSASDVRRRIEYRKPIRGLVPASVEDYIRKVALYR
jgi:nicotinic acid mononucleotide adenylyltransferase